MKCGLLGRKLSHSYSPFIHSLLGEYDYDLFEAEPAELGSFISRTEISGFNVTIPYKKDIIPHLDELSDVAKKLGAVNTVVRRTDGRLVGHNTDYYGFRSLLEKSRIPVSGKKVLVLGSGGASNTVVHVLHELGANVVVISRSGEDNYRNIRRHRDADVIVNTTPVGMYPNAGSSPVSLDDFDRLEGVVDIVYNPAKTKLLLEAESRGIPCINGSWMLVAQAKESAEWFTGKTIPDSEISRVHRKLVMKMRNIVLVGMPGCGKTSVGAELSKRCGIPLIDSDAQIQAVTGKTIPQIFSQDGETVFRKLETQVLSDLGQRSGIILATGGGCLTIPENAPLLRQNGTVIWLRRQLDRLPTDGRPLSQSTSLQKLYEQRKHLYDRYSDIAVDNDGDIQDTVDTIINYLEGAI